MEAKPNYHKLIKMYQQQFDLLKEDLALNVGKLETMRKRSILLTEKLKAIKAILADLAKKV
jgi:hypothetical protein